ncbi:hypothetical protein A1O7_05047 [Cladophialophora yegresii CBS 114405]|uniref:F-box domain-containing protein n=1 Tax=Cladophialophora yegresii CBS 114405 TaxID=1182544 RepID=W9WRD4_9EURO|nr:uncharacterized protein A1O7_05047 [Cladophialophora yegresii CBS 114405]EXJ60894.1 hypothetical protein A1O7_05047 [Cladophialophora yegresii CBS 114405]
MITNVFRRTNTVCTLDTGGPSGESSRRPSAADIHAPGRPSLAVLSLRLPSRSKRSNSSKEVDPGSESTQKLWEALLALPGEITAQIFCYLPLADIFALRLASRSVHAYLRYHAGAITRSLLLQCAYEHTTDYEGRLDHDRARYLYDYIQTIYPPPQPCTSFDYLLQTLKRQAQVQKMLQVLTNWLQMKVYVLPKFKRCDNFNPYKHRLIRRLHVAAWTMYHFLESYRTILVSEHPSHEAEPVHYPDGRCSLCLQSVKELLRVYPGTELVPAYHFYGLCRGHLHALSRAPSAGRLRAKKSPSDADLIQFIVLGGVGELCRLSLLKGSSNQRIEVIANFVDKVSSAAIQQRIRAANAPSSSTEAGAQTPFDDLIAPLQTPFHLIHHSTISSLPELQAFVTGTDAWVTEMYSRLRPGDQIAGAWEFVYNILNGKSERSAAAGAKERRGSKSPDSDLDFLAPEENDDG